MKFLVTDIEFDFNTDMPDYYSVSFDDQQLIVNDNLGVWEADDEDDEGYTHVELTKEETEL